MVRLTYIYLIFSGVISAMPGCGAEGEVLMVKIPEFHERIGST
jgi:hypothetical protein